LKYQTVEDVISSTMTTGVSTTKYKQYIIHSCAFIQVT